MDLTKKQAKDCDKIKHFEVDFADVCEDKKGNIRVKEKRNNTFWHFLRRGCSKLKNHGAYDYCKDNMFDLVYRLFYPKRADCLKNLYRGKSILWLRILLDALPIIITILINVYLVLKYPNAYYTFWLPR